MNDYLPARRQTDYFQIFPENLQLPNTLPGEICLSKVNNGNNEMKKVWNKFKVKQ